MIKADIHTDIGIFTVNASFLGATDLGAAHQEVQETLRNGGPFGTGNGIISIEPAAQIKAVRVYYDEVVEEPGTAEEPPLADGIYPFASNTLYLGQPTKFEGLWVRHNSHNYYLPMTINENVALAVVGPTKLEEMLFNYATQQAEIIDETEGNFTVLIPPAPLANYEEAAEYIADYIKEKEAEKDYVPENKNAKAFTAWRDK